MLRKNMSRKSIILTRHKFVLIVTPKFLETLDPHVFMICKVDWMQHYCYMAAEKPLYRWYMSRRSQREILDQASLQNVKLLIMYKWFFPLDKSFNIYPLLLEINPFHGIAMLTLHHLRNLINTCWFTTCFMCFSKFD